MSITPCGDHTQLCSGLPFTLRYFPSTTSLSHSTREKLIRQRSPSFGGIDAPSSFNPTHGHLISIVQPVSLSRGSSGVPSIFTAVFSPVISQALTAFPASLYGLVRSRSHVVLRALSSSSPYRWLSPSGSRNTS